MIEPKIKRQRIFLSSGLALAALALAAAFPALVVTMALAGGEAGEEELRQLYGPRYYQEDPHGVRDGCRACHQGEPAEGRPQLRGDANTLCTVCHARGKAGREPHPVGGVGTEKVKIPAAFPLDGAGRTTCLTCHDHLPLCQNPGREAKGAFLRPVVLELEPTGGAESLSFCYACHLEDEVAAYNPHERQVTAAGEIEERRCLFCHRERLDPQVESERGDYRLRKEISVICIGCHLLTPHAGAAEHLEEPSEAVLATLREAEERLKVVLPLDEKERVNCATCHNPHQEGVFPVGSPAGALYTEAEIPPEVVAKYRNWARPGEGRKSFRLGLPDFQAALRSVEDLKPERNMRLSARDGSLCAACHGPGGIDR